jgi:geranylgeranyl diphosphate synthase type II
VNAFAGYLEAARVEVDAALERWVPARDAGGDLAAAMRHITFASGKRFRPALVLLTCEHAGGERAAALPAAAAVELVHAYSLVHDDLPCMDDALLRRGRPCAHVVYGEALGVLAGDGLQALAFGVLAQHTPPGCPVGAMAAALADAAGWAGMVGGQADDLAGEGRPPEVDRVRRIHAGKTAAMIAVSLRLGALAAGAGPARAAELAEAGHDLGLAFQIVDDLLDVRGTTAELGKAAGADAAREKMTWPAAVGVEAAGQDAQALVAGALRRIGPGARAGEFEALGRFLLDRRG